MRTLENSRDPVSQSRLLVYGPSGCGKTAFASACFNEAQESDAGWITTTLVASQILEDPMTNINRAFEAIERYGVKGLLIENVDYLFTSVLSNPASYQLLFEKIEGTNALQLLIATTRHPEHLSSRELEVFNEVFPLLFPDEEQRLDILRVHTRNIKLHNSVDLREIANSIPWWNGKEIYELMNGGSSDSLTAQALCERISFIGQSIHVEKRVARMGELLKFTESHCTNTPVRKGALSRYSELMTLLDGQTPTSRKSPNEESLHPNIHILISRMHDALNREDYSGVLHASASIFETLAKDIIGIPSVQDQTLKSFFNRYRKDSGLPNAVLDYILAIYDSRNVTPLAGHGSIQTPIISRQEAISLCEMTKAFVKIEYKLREASGGGNPT